MNKTVIKFINEEVKNDITYNDIKDKIDVTKFLQKKELHGKKYAFRLTAILCGILLFVIGGFATLNIRRINYLNSNIVLYKTDKEYIDSYDYVYIGKVDKELTTKGYDGTGTDIPYTFYQISIVENLKGVAEDTERICFYGGKEYLNTWTLYNENSELLEKDKIYLFFTNKKNPNSENNRADKDDFIIVRNDQKVLLQDYKINEPIDSQNSNIKMIVNRYSNVINKVTEYDIFIPTFASIEEMVKNYDYIFIAKTKPFYRNNNTVSEVPMIICEFNYVNIFKGNDLSNKKLNYYGVNYWFDDETLSNGVKEPNNEEIYLIFANDSPNNASELLIVSNLQQIKLEGYDTNLSFEKQNESVLQIINKYIQYID